MKKIVALVLCFAMVAAFAPAIATAVDRNFSAEQALAEDLKALGLFKGVSEDDFALDRAPTRVEALVMLIRVLGKENDALSKGGKHPFLDVPSWADKYVGYAYTNNLTNGVSATKFGSDMEASSSMYLTFVLRALGYSDTNGADFTWDNPYTLARTTGILMGNPDTINFLRADVVKVSYAALEATLKGSKTTLAEKLISAGAISAAAYDKYYDVLAFENAGASTFTAEEIYKRCSPAVFYIEIYDANGRAVSSGSGFFIDSDGTAVTNYHVIEDAASAKIRRSDNNDICKVEGVYDYSEKNDWAIIKVQGKNFPCLEIDYTPVTGASTVYAIGSPLGLENTISEGLVSNANRNFDGVSYIQISAAISHGSSGGALINKSGKVVGITSAGFDEGQNLNLALPISVIKGHSKGNVYPFSAVSRDETPLVGNVNLDDYTEEEAAYMLLVSFVNNYSNATLDGTPAFLIERESDSGMLLQFIATEGDTSDLYLEVRTITDQMITFASMESSAGGKRVPCSVGVYMADSGREIASGEALINKADFREGMNVYLDSFKGDYTVKYDLQDLASSMYTLMLYYADSIFNDYLSTYDTNGVVDMGFVNLYD